MQVSQTLAKTLRTLILNTYFKISFLEQSGQSFTKRSFVLFRNLLEAPRDAIKISLIAPQT